MEGRKICPHFLKGNCRRGVNCGYIHSLEAGSSTSADLDKKVEQLAQAAQVRCPHFEKGYCRTGDTCKFAHVNGNPEPVIIPHGPGSGSRVKHQPLAEDKKQKLREADLLNVCFRWAHGSCENTACRFSHRHLEPWEIKMFKELLDSNEASPTALPANDQVPLNTGPAGSGKSKAQKDKAGEGRQWDTTVPLVQPAPLTLEPPVRDKLRFDVPRPHSSLRKGVKVSMPGSTILRRKLGDHSITRIMPSSGQQRSRSVLNQPCVLASSPGQPEKLLQHQRTWVPPQSFSFSHFRELEERDYAWKRVSFPIGFVYFEPPWNATETCCRLP